MGGSLGMAAGEAVITGLETAVDRGTPFIMFAASGGARMQEGILSLMQLPRTTVAVQMLRDAKQPYIVVLTNPTTGGVTASYAMLGDVHIAEPGALIGFAGPRVIEQTIREKLPDGFQRVRISARPRHGRHGGASPQAARDAGRAVPRADQGAGRAAPTACATLPELPRGRAPKPGPRRLTLRASRRRRHERLRRHPRAAARAASQADRSVARPHVAPPRRARPSGAAAAAGDPCRRHQRQGLDHRLHARDAGGGRHAASTSTPRRISCASTSASASARRAAASWSATRRWPRRWTECERANGGEPITVFEIETAAAFLLFSRHPADVLLLEVGLGGRLDATNVIEQPLASVDHAGVDGPSGVSRRHAREDRRREGRDPQARRAGGDRAAARRRARA